MPAAIAKVATETPTKAGLRKSERSSIGRSCRASTTTKTTSSAAPKTSVETIRPLPQPSAFPRRSPKTIRNSDTENVTRPAKSVRTAPTSRDSTIRVLAISNANAPTGTLTKKTQRQPSASVRMTADKRARSHRRSNSGAPNGDRTEAVGAAILVSDQRQCGREQRRAADALQAPGDVERRDVPGEAAKQRGAGEHDNAEHEQKAPAESVGESTRGQNQRRESERIGVDNPLKTGQVRGKSSLNARQRDIHDRDVEQQHERRHADGDQRPAAGLGSPRCHGRHHKKTRAIVGRSPLTRPLPGAIASAWWPPSTGSTALKASTTSLDRNQSSGRSRTQSTRARSARPTCSLGREGPARPRSPGSWPRR